MKLYRPSDLLYYKMKLSVYNQNPSIFSLNVATPVDIETCRSEFSYMYHFVYGLMPKRVKFGRVFFRPLSLYSLVRIAGIIAYF